MLKADQFIKDSHFAEAKAEVQKAKALDPSNMYINAFIDRISYFEEQKRADAAKKEKELIQEAAVAAAAAPKSESIPKQAPPAPQPAKASQSVGTSKSAGAPAQKKEGAVPSQGQTIPSPQVKPQPMTPVPPKKEPPITAAPRQQSAPPASAKVSETKKTPAAAGAQPTVQSSQPTVPVQPKKEQPIQPVAPKPPVAPVSAQNAEMKKSPATAAVKPTASTAQSVVPPPQAKAVSPQSVPPKNPKPAEAQMPSDIPPTAVESRQQQQPIQHAVAPAEKAPSIMTPQAAALTEEKTNTVGSPNIHDLTAEKQITAQQLAAMKKQIEKLSLALEQEKMAREEMHQQQVQKIIPQFRTMLENAWIDGAPSDAKKAELLQLARTMTIPDALINSLQREVKIAMYGKAVKEVITKRRVIRHASSTLDWLRKVYQITMEEYVEYESKFLLDLVADQYKGIILQISSDEETRSFLTPKLKAAGYAVILSPSPEDALEKIDKLNPNLIVCESSFGPGTISGIRFLHILRTNSKYNFVPFILLSTPEDHALLTASDLRPNEGYLVKPVNDEELSAMINGKLLWFKEYVMSLSQ